MNPKPQTPGPRGGGSLGFEARGVWRDMFTVISITISTRFPMSSITMTLTTNTTITPIIRIILPRYKGGFPEG